METIRQWFAPLVVIALCLGCSCNCGTGEPAAGAVAAETVTQVSGPFTTRPTDDSMPPGPQPIAANTGEFYVAWAAPLNAGEQVHGVLVAAETGGVVPPNTEVLSSDYTAPQAGQQWGVLTYGMPTAGWPPGQYRVDVTRASGPVGSVSFQIQ